MIRTLRSTPLRVAVVLGTRPEAIKLAPVLRCLRQQPERFATHVIATGQHQELLDQVLTRFEIVPDVRLDVMRPDQTLEELTSRILKAVGRTFRENRPDVLLVQGDTTTVFASSLAAFYERIPVAHVEAGLRSHDLQNPFPEEANRHLVSVLTELHFAPTAHARAQLLKESVNPERIVVTGNTVVDALNELVDQPFSDAQGHLADLPTNGRMLLVTSHRRESWGQDLEQICLALKDLTREFPDLHVVYPVHLNPNVRHTVSKVLEGTDRIFLKPPLDYLAFIQLMKRSHLILTDSGGVQEEAPTLRKPLLVLRRVTERPEAFESGRAKVVGTNREDIVREAGLLLHDLNAHQAMVKGGNPYGDGRAAERIALVLHRWSEGESPLLRSSEEFAALS